MKKDLFEYSDYKPYLTDLIKNRPSHGHGFRSKIAEAIGCRVAYISQVLNSAANFSPEQADALSKFLGHTGDEADYFLLLIGFERAGTASLKNRIRKQIAKVHEKRLVLKDRVDIKQALDLVDQATYYSAWYYAAVHILLTIEKYQTREAIAEYLRLPLEKVSDILEFLLSVGLASQDKGRFSPGVSRIFLGNDSPMISKHHTNWRMRAIDSFDKGLKTDLHFSTVISLAKEDVKKIKEQLVKNIEEARAVVRNSLKEEELHCFSLDFFKI